MERRWCAGCQRETWHRESFGRWVCQVCYAIVNRSISQGGRNAKDVGDSNSDSGDRLRVLVAHRAK